MNHFGYWWVLCGIRVFAARLVGFGASGPACWLPRPGWGVARPGSLRRSRSVLAIDLALAVASNRDRFF